MRRDINHFLRWLLLVVLILGFCCTIVFRWYEIFTYPFLKTHHDILVRWVADYYFYTIIIYMLTYISVVAFSLPAALLMTLLGGFLFGPLAIIYITVSATIGSTILFWAVQTTVGRWFSHYKKNWVEHLRKGMEKNAFNYLLAIRLIPIFPFWAVNIAAGLLSVKPRIFVIATFIGIIPGTFVYVMIGHSLHGFFQSDTLPDMKIIFSPAILLPLLGLAVLALLPILFKDKYQSHDKE